MTPTDQEVKAVLEAAKELIADEKDWCGDGWGWGEQICVAHAVEKAVNGTYMCPLYIEALARVGDAAGAPPWVEDGRHGSHLEHMIGPWNDDPATTHADVLAAMDKAIDSLSEDGSDRSHFGGDGEIGTARCQGEIRHRHKGSTISEPARV